MSFGWRSCLPLQEKQRVGGWQEQQVWDLQRAVESRGNLGCILEKDCLSFNCHLKPDFLFSGIQEVICNGSIPSQYPYLTVLLSSEASHKIFLQWEGWRRAGCCTPCAQLLAGGHTKPAPTTRPEGIWSFCFHTQY